MSETRFFTNIKFVEGHSRLNELSLQKKSELMTTFFKRQKNPVFGPFSPFFGCFFFKLSFVTQTLKN